MGRGLRGRDLIAFIDGTCQSVTVEGRNVYTVKEGRILINGLFILNFQSAHS